MDYPYTNTHELNLDWIIGIIKDFQNNYSGISEALDQAIAAITAKGEATEDDIEALRIAAGLAIEQMKTQSINAVAAQQTASVVAVDASATDAINRITNLVNSVPANYEDALGQLEVINAILNGTESESITWAQGFYQFNSTSQGYEINPSNYYVCSVMQGGCNGHRVKIKSNNNAQKIYAIDWWDANFSLLNRVSQGWVPEIEYVFPQDAHFFSIILTAAANPTDVQISVAQTDVSIEWDSIICDIKNNTIYKRLNTSDITESLSFTEGYVNKQGVVVGTSTTYKYSAKIDVSEGDIFSTAEYPFRYVTAYSGNTAIAGKSAEAVMTYTVPAGIDGIILTMYVSSTGRVLRGEEEPYNLFYNSISQKNVGYFEKPYICLSCDDGADELATYTIPMIIAKGVPCTFGLYKTSPVFQHGHTQAVVNAVNNNNCEIAQHGGQPNWTDFSAEELVAFFNDEELFWRNIGVEVKSAIYPTHLSNPMVRAITGSRFGCCRSGYNYDGVLYYDDESKPAGSLPYYATGPRSNLYAMSSWNMPAGRDLQFVKDCIDWAIANNKLIHFYWHDWDLDAASKSVLEAAIDYAKTQNINFIKLSEVPYIK